jgi:hypothetical protein
MKYVTVTTDHFTVSDTDTLKTVLLPPPATRLNQRMTVCAPLNRSIVVQWGHRSYRLGKGKSFTWPPVTFWDHVKACWMRLWV